MVFTILNGWVALFIVVPKNPNSEFGPPNPEETLAISNVVLFLGILLSRIGSYEFGNNSFTKPISLL